MKNKTELSDLVINEFGQLCIIPGISRVIEYGEFGFSKHEFAEYIINKISNVTLLEEFDQPAMEKYHPSVIRLGFNQNFVDPIIGW